jgi:type II secretory pathway component GspD/PulD (secretin)
MASGILNKVSIAIASFATAGIIAVHGQAPPPELPATATTAEQEVLVEQLRSLLAPSKLAEQKRARRPPAKPYYKIIPGIDGYSTLVYRFRYVEANKEMVNAAESTISSQGIVERTSEQNMLVVHDRTDKMDELVNLMISLDVEAPQVLVEAKVVEVTLGDGMQRNLDFAMSRHDTTTGTGGTTKDLNSTAGTSTSIQGQPKSDTGLTLDWFPYVSDNKNFQVTLQWLMHGQRAKILSAPNIIVSRNATATITTGEEVPIQSSQTTSGTVSNSTTYKQVGVILEIQPKYINEDMVTLAINPQVSNITSYSQIKTGDTSYAVPSMSIRKIETTLNVADGQVVMMGGLYSDKETLNEERIPFLSDIPYFGEFFTSKNRGRELMQLIFFIRVTILSSDDIPQTALYDIGAQAEQMRDLGKTIQNSKEIFPEDLDANKTTLEQIKKEFLDKNNPPE